MYGDAAGVDPLLGDDDFRWGAKNILRVRATEVLSSCLIKFDFLFTWINNNTHGMSCKELLMQWLAGALSDILKIAIGGILGSALTWWLYAKVRYRIRNARVVMGKMGGAGADVIIEPQSIKRSVVIDDPAELYLMRNIDDNKPAKLEIIKNKFNGVTVAAQSNAKAVTMMYAYDPEKYNPKEYSHAKIIIKPNSCWFSKKTIVKISYIAGHYG